MAFESEETIWGLVRQSNERIEYQGILRVEGAGKNRVSLELSFVPPHPFLLNMPERLHIQAKSITQAYSKLVRLFDQHCVDLNS